MSFLKGINNQIKFDNINMLINKNIVGACLINYIQCKIGGSYMSAHFITIVKRAGENDKMRGLPSMLSRFYNKRNILNKTGARTLDSTFLSYDVKIS